MIHIYHILTICFIIYELFWLYSPRENVSASEKLTKLSKDHKDKEWDNYTEEYKSLIKRKLIPHLIILLWVIIGLLTFNWVAFALFFVFNFVIILPLGRLTRFSTAYMVIHLFNSLIGLLFGIFILLNHYHLRISLYEVVKQLLL